MSIPIKPEAAENNNNFVMPTIEGIKFVNYINEEQLDDVMRLVGQDLSEPYSVFTYRYFLHRWPQLCILAVPTDDPDGKPIGCVVCKIDLEDGDSSEDAIAAPTVEEIEAATAADEQSSGAAAGEEGAEDKENAAQTSNNMNIDTINNNINKVFTGYIGMLAVHKTHRRSGIGTALVQRAIHRMKTMGRCQSIRLETEVTNKGAMNLYEDRLGFVREELLKKYYLNWGDAYRLRLWLDC